MLSYTHINDNFNTIYTVNVDSTIMAINLNHHKVVRKSKTIISDTQIKVKLTNSDGQELEYFIKCESYDKNYTNEFNCKLNTKLEISYKCSISDTLYIKYIKINDNFILCKEFGYSIQGYDINGYNINEFDRNGNRK